MITNIIKRIIDNKSSPRKKINIKKFVNSFEMNQSLSQEKLYGRKNVKSMLRYEHRKSTYSREENIEFIDTIPKSGLKRLKHDYLTYVKKAIRKNEEEKEADRIRKLRSICIKQVYFCIKIV